MFIINNIFLVFCFSSSLSSLCQIVCLFDEDVQELVTDCSSLRDAFDHILSRKGNIDAQVIVKLQSKEIGKTFVVRNTSKSNEVKVS